MYMWTSYGITWGKVCSIYWIPDYIRDCLQDNYGTWLWLDFRECGLWRQPHTSIIARHRRFRWMVRMWQKMGVRVTWDNGKNFGKTWVAPNTSCSISSTHGVWSKLEFCPKKELPAALVGGSYHLVTCQWDMFLVGVLILPVLLNSYKMGWSSKCKMDWLP